MSKTKKPRTKRYVARECLQDPVSWAVAGVHTLPTESQQAAMVPVDGAVALLKQGMAGRDDWNMIVQALNIAEALAGLQIGPNLMPQIEAGQEALHAIALRMIARRTATCYATELHAIDEALAMYRAQLKLCTQAEFSRAIARVKELHRSGAMVYVARVFEKLTGERNVG